MIVAGKHLSEHCRAEYPKRVNHALWIIAELAIVASDIPEGEAEETTSIEVTPY